MNEDAVYNEWMNEEVNRQRKKSNGKGKWIKWEKKEERIKNE